MRTELDAIPSTITLSMGLKNKIRALKGKRTYEEYLSQLLRKSESAQSASRIELTEFERASNVYVSGDFKVLYDYNRLIDSHSHIFDIQVRRVVHKGEPSDLNALFERHDTTILRASYVWYFELLEQTIRDETSANFSHKGRFEDHDRWREEFENLGLSKRAYEFDVKDKLVEYESGVVFR